MIISNKSKWLFSLLTAMILYVNAYTQWDASTPRYLTRSKLWTTYRMTGLQGQQAFSSAGANDQAGLSYPGSSIRIGEYIVYWNAALVGEVTGGAGAGAMSPNAARYENSHGEGTFLLAKANGEKFISYSGPRTVSPDVVIVGYDPWSGPEADLGVDDAKSTYWPGGPPFDPEEPIEIHNYQYGKYIGRDNEAEEIIVVRWTTGMGITATKKAKAWSYQKYDDFIIVENVFEYTGDSNGDGLLDSSDVFGSDLPVLTDVYFSFANMLSASLAGETWGDDIIGSWGSGLPYSPSSVEQLQLPDREFKNSARKPTRYNLDLRASKDFIYNNIDFSVFVRIYNLLDHLNQEIVFDVTGYATENAACAKRSNGNGNTDPV